MKRTPSPKRRQRRRERRRQAGAFEGLCHAVAAEMGLARYAAGLAVCTTGEGELSAAPPWFYDAGQLMAFAALSLERPGDEAALEAAFDTLAWWGTVAGPLLLLGPGLPELSAIPPPPPEPRRAWDVALHYADAFLAAADASPLAAPSAASPAASPGPDRLVGEFALYALQSLAWARIIRRTQHGTSF